MDIVERVREVVAQALNVPLVAVTPHAVLADLAALDSLKLAEILAGLDDAFHTHVLGEELTAAVSIDDLVRLVEQSPPR